MKILRYALALLVIILFGAYVLLFTGFGNQIVTKYVENTVKQKSGLELKFIKFNVSINSIDITASINDEISLKTSGAINVFLQKFDLNYNVAINSLKTANIRLTKSISLNGQARGKVSNFDINGIGELLGSDISFLINLKDFKPYTTQINAKKIDIAEILSLTKQPNYVNGLIDIVANITENNSKRDGIADIYIYNGIVNNNTILNDFNITLPSNFTFKGDIKSIIKDDIVTAKTNIITSIATANTRNTKFNIAKNFIDTDFTLDLPELFKLEPIINQKLNGALNLNGNTQIRAGNLENLEAVLNGFGGDANIILKDGSLNANIHKLKIEELLKLSAKPKLVDGVIYGKATLKNINDNKSINGDIALQTTSAKLNASELNKLGLNLNKNIDISLDIKSNVKNSVANFNANLISELLNLRDINGVFNIDKNDVKSNFKLDVSDLSKLESIVGAKLSSDVNLVGNVELKNMTLSKLDISGKALGGDINAVLKDEKLSTNLNNLTIKDLFLLVGAKPLANGVLNLNANISSFNIKNINGEAKISLKNGEFYEKAMSEMLEKSFPKGVKFNIDTNAKIAKNIVNFNGVALSDLINLKDIKGSFDIEKGVLNSDTKVEITDLRKLKFISSKELFGNLIMDINLNKHGKNLTLKANSNVINGKLNAVLKNENLNATLDKFTFKGLTDLLGMDNFYNGVGNATFSYNTKLQNGEFNIDINEGKLVANKFTNTIKTLTMRDITDEIYKNGLVKGTINNGLIKFNMNMKAQRSDINTSSATFDTINDALNIPIDFRYEKTDAKINITGTSKEQKYSVKSEYIKEKLIKGIDKLIDKKLDKDDGSKDAVKNLIKGLF